MRWRKPQVSAVLLALAIGMGPSEFKELLVPPPGETGAYLGFATWIVRFEVQLHRRLPGGCVECSLSLTWPHRAEYGSPECFEAPRHNVI